MSIVPHVLKLSAACGIAVAGLACANPGTSTPAGATARVPSTPRSPNANMQAVLDELGELNPEPIAGLSPEQARQQPTPADAVMALLRERGQSTEPEGVANVEDRSIRTNTRNIPVKVYTPVGDGPFPVIVYFHGGGWVIADPQVYDASARALTNAAEAVVVSVDYRKAPENPYPAAAEDAFAAYRYVLRNAGEFNGDPQRIAVAGESAGGNLATVTCLMAARQNVRMPVHQLLVYPVTNHAFDTPSYQTYADAKPLNADMMRWFWGHYLPNEQAGNEPTASPLRAQNLSAMPPTTLITAEIDPLTSEGRAYGQRLREAGVNVRERHFDGVVHEFFGMGAVLPEAADAVSFAAEGLRRSFRR